MKEALSFCQEGSFRKLYNSTMEVTPEEKKKIEKMIVDTSIDALEAGAIREYDLSVIADFVLKKIDTVKTQEEMRVFLEELATKWQFFLPIERFLEGEIQHVGEMKAITQAQAHAKEGNVESALAAIKAA